METLLFKCCMAFILLTLCSGKRDQGSEMDAVLERLSNIESDLSTLLAYTKSRQDSVTVDNEILRTSQLAGSNCELRFTCSEPDVSSRTVPEPPIRPSTTPRPKKCPKGWTKLPDSGKCVKVFKTLKSFGEASKSCKGHSPGGNLVSVHSKADNDLMYNSFARDERHHVWLGLHDLTTEGQFQWTDDSVTDYLNWHPREPNNAHGNEDCVHFGLGGKDKWNDASCSSKFFYICQVYPS